MGSGRGTWRRWLEEPLGGRSFRTLRLASEDKATVDVEAEPEPAPLRVDVDIATVTVTAWTADDESGYDEPRPPWERQYRPDSADALRVLESSRAELSSILQGEALRWLGRDVVVGPLRIERGSVHVIHTLLAAAGIALPSPAAIRAYTAAAAEAVKAFFPPGTIVGTSDSWTPGTGLTSPAPPPPEPKPERGDARLVAWLLGAGAFMTATLALIGASGADLDPARLNHPWLFSIAFGVIVACILVGVLWPAWQARQDVKRWQMLGLSGAVALVGVAVATIASLATNALSEKTKPRISARLDQGSGGVQLVGTVNAHGVRNTRHMVVSVVGVAGDTVDELYSSRTGPDGAGKVEVALQVPIPVGLYDRLDILALTSGQREKSTTCVTDRKREFGCVTLRVPVSAQRPRLTASWKTPLGHPPLLAIHARMGGVGPNDRVLLSVRRRNAAGVMGGRVYAATWAAGADGLVDEDLVIPVRRDKQSLCVIMRSLRGAVPAADAGPYGPCHARRHGVSVLLAPRPPIP